MRPLLRWWPTGTTSPTTGLAKHGRTYKDHAEKARRYEVFRSNAEFVDSYNAAAVAARGKSSRSRPRLATNKFSDLTGEEFEAMYLKDNVGKVGRLISKRFNGSIPGFMYGSLSESGVPRPAGTGQPWAPSPLSRTKPISVVRTEELSLSIHISSYS